MTETSTFTKSANIIYTRTIEDILFANKKFLIPSYQRGYRWTEQQVIDLLDDIWEFHEKSGRFQDKFYCLQPIVVQENDNKWELIDGQQRMTTILIILSYLRKALEARGVDNMLEIEFETRPNSQRFLKNLSNLTSLDNTNIDFYYISKALSYVKNWFESKKLQNRSINFKFIETLLSQTKVIWYEVNLTDHATAIDIFTRLNMGKIPLTNAELIKALFLRSENFQEDNVSVEGISTSKKEAIRLRQLEISSEWDRMEYLLQNDEFWYFLTNGNRKDNPRIGYLLDLLASEINNESEEKNKVTKIHNEYFAFLVFDKYFKSMKLELNDAHSIIEKIWSKIKAYFLIFEEWFSDRFFYHSIGFLIATGEKIDLLKREFNGKSKSSFKNYLLEKTKDKVFFSSLAELKKLKYKDDHKHIKMTLLFHNVFTTYNKNDYLKFPFHKFNKIKFTDWTLEHIHAQNSEQIGKQHRKDWLVEHKESICQIKPNGHQNLVKDIDKLLTSKRIEDYDFIEISEKILKKLTSNEKSKEHILDSISNIALLDKKSNSALNNSAFAVKRRKIIELEKAGMFIPTATFNIFMKYYTKNPNKLHFWEINDRDCYVTDIFDTITNFLSSKK